MRIYERLLWSLFIVQFIYSAEEIKFDTSDSVFIKQTLDSLLLAQNSMALQYEILHYNNEFKEIIYQPLYSSYEVDTVIINSNENIKQSYLEHVSKIFYNFKIDKETNTNIEKKKKTIINKYYFVRSTPNMNIFKYQGDKLGIYVDIDPKFNNYFSGLFGGRKARKDRWEYNGEIDAHFENVWGAMEKLIFKWKAIDSTNQEFNLELHRPHLLRGGVGLILSSNYELVNNNYIQEKYELKVELLNSFYGSYYAGYTQGSINATDTGLEEGFISSNYKALSFMFRNNSLNNMILPSKGSRISFELEIGEDSELKNLYIKYKKDFEMYAPIIKNLNSCFKFYGEHINALHNDVGKAREVFFGGVNSLRGYDDNLFRSTSILIPSFEFHYNGINSISSLIFFEGGLSKNFKPKLSYGFGLKKITNNALINIEYAIPYMSSISKGKVHIKWLTRL